MVYTIMRLVLTVRMGQWSAVQGRTSADMEYTIMRLVLTVRMGLWSSVQVRTSGSVTSADGDYGAGILGSGLNQLHREMGQWSPDQF